MKMYRTKGLQSIRLPNGDYLVLISGPSSEKLQLEGVFAMIWDKLERGTTAEEILEWLSDEHDLSQVVARKESKKILAHMNKIGLIEEVE